MNIKQTYTAFIKQDGDWWIGWIEDVPGVNCQELSRADLLSSLREALLESLAFSIQEASVGSKECELLHWN